MPQLLDSLSQLLDGLALLVTKQDWGRAGRWLENQGVRRAGGWASDDHTRGSARYVSDGKAFTVDRLSGAVGKGKERDLGSTRYTEGYKALDEEERKEDGEKERISI